MTPAQLIAAAVLLAAIIAVLAWLVMRVWRLELDLERERDCSAGHLRHDMRLIQALADLEHRLDRAGIPHVDGRQEVPR